MTKYYKNIKINICYLLLATIFQGCVSFDEKLLQCVEDNNLIRLKQLLNDDPQLINKKLFASSWSCQVSTVLLVEAAESNNLAIVKYLIDNGADVNACDLYGSTALMEAASNNNIEIARYLIEKGANIDKVNERKRSAFLAACCCGNYEMVVFLLEKGANIFLKDHQDEGGLFLVIKYALNYKDKRDSAIKIIKKLIENGLDVNQINDMGHTALYYAILLNDYEICKILIDAGAIYDNKPDMKWVTKYCNSELLKYLDNAKRSK